MRSGLGLAWSLRLRWHCKRQQSLPATQLPKQPAAIDAVALLTEDHEHVKAMIEEYEGLGERAFASKKKLSTNYLTR